MGAEISKQRRRSWSPSSGKPKPLWVWKQQAESLIELLTMSDEMGEFSEYDHRAELTKLLTYLESLGARERDGFVRALALELRRIELTEGN